MERQLLISLIFIFALSGCQTITAPTLTIEQKIEISEESIQTEIQYTNIWDYIVKNSNTEKELHIDNVTLEFIDKHLKNKDLWIELDNYVSIHDVKWSWVKGHSGHEQNEIADQLANRGIDLLLNENG